MDEKIYGWAGVILRVDLNREKVVKQPLPEELSMNFLGGAGINAKILYDEVPPEVNEFDPENRLIAGVGPLTGTLLPTGGRTTFTARSPLTFAFGDSNVGGHFGSELKFAGYDIIVFQGRASRPLYLWIDDDKVELRDASKLWGRDVFQTDDMIKEELGDPDLKIASIGPAGENLVRSAAIMTDRTRAAGWGGVGAVMGSKRLKAIAVRGTRGVQVAHPEKIEDLFKKCVQMMKGAAKYKWYSYYGKPWLTWLRNEKQKSNPTKNFTLPRVPASEFPKVDHEAFAKHIIRWKGCFNCQMHCGHVLRGLAGPYKDIVGEGYEYNQLIDGYMMGIFDLNFVLKWTVETNRLGVDCDWPAYTIAWAMELWEKRIISEKDTDGIKLEWGNQEAALTMLNKIVYRDGFGDLLAEGAWVASKKLGRGSEKFAHHSKGGRLEIDPRTGWGTALSHATSTRGADHLKGMPLSNAYGKWAGIEYNYADDSSVEHKAEAVIFFENLNAVIDSLTLCKNVTWTQSEDSFGLPEFSEWMYAVTGREFSPVRLLEIGERIYNVERAFNSKCGLTRDNDTFTDKFFTEPIESKIRVLDRNIFEKLKDRYYEKRGWDVKTGHPTKEKLVSLGLSDVADDLIKRGIIKG
ncbi:MAG: aldehyde ferredoxin oxidoreductase family protein [Candidatus Hadarchaeales archaeon]